MIATTYSASDYLLSLFAPDDTIAIMTMRQGEKPNHLFAKASEAASSTFMESLRKQNEAGSNIYVCMNPLSANQRVKANVGIIRTVYIDIDQDSAGALEKISQSMLVPPPHFILQSSPNKFQVIWVVTGIEPAEQERLLAGLIQEFGGDPAVKDCTRVLRLPGFINHKYDTKPVVEILKTNFDGKDYTAADFQVTVAPFKLAEKIPLVIEAGDRNNRLASLAGKLRREGFEQVEILAALQTANRRCSVPLSDAEVATIATSISKYNPTQKKVVANPFNTSGTSPSTASGAQTKPIAIIRNADDIEPIQVTWLWHERIPYGMITLFAGNPGNGKSMASVACAAICSTGGKFPATPFSVAAQDVLLLIGEDDIARTVVPRLKAAQANMKRIHILDAVRPVQGEDRAVCLDTDRQAVEDALEAHPNIRLLIIDPISNYLGKVSMVAEQEVRSVLTPIMQMAERRGVAVILVMHLNKKSDLDAIMRVGGAMAFVGVSRCSWLFAKNEQEEKPEGEDITVATDQHGEEFSMLRMKNNLAPSRNTGLSYSIAVNNVRMKGVDVPTPYIKWGSTFDGTADHALSPSSKVKSKQATQNAGGRPNDEMIAAIRWLETGLQDNQPHPSKSLLKDAYDARGIKDSTLRRAYEAMGGDSPFKVDGHYCWRWAPMCEPKAAKEDSQQSHLVMVEGAD